jgi:pimeloyl-ACP methyl ester carboxylesterase
MAPILGLALLTPEGLVAQSSDTDFLAGLERIEIPVGDFVFDGLAAGPADGQLVLFLHGFPQTSVSYRDQLRAVGQAGYRAVAFDQRGYSPGARPEAFTEYAVPNLVGDVLGVADALGATTFHLVGHDWGGALVWVLGAAAPERLLSLTVLSTPHISALAAERADPDSEQSRRSSYFDLFSSEGAEAGFLADDAAGLKGMYASLEPAAAQAYLDELGSPEALRAALAWYRAAFGQPSQPGAGPGPSSPPVAVSTVFVFGTDDVAFSWESAERTGDFVEGPYRLVALDGASHWLPEHEADAVTRIILGHVSERSGDPNGVEATLGDLRAAFSRALVEGDGGAVAAAYAPDGALLPPGREVRGEDAIARYFTSGRGGYRQVAHSMIPDEVRLAEGTVTEVGTWSSTIQRSGEDHTTTSNRYLLTWRLDGGQWRIVYDIWHR